MDSARARPVVKGVLAGGLAGGLIDIAYAIVVNGSKGVSATAVLQSVASGLMGTSAYKGGIATALLGTLLHFLIIMAMALAFILAARRSELLRRNLLTAGLAYGTIIYFAMRWVVVPLSRFPGDLRTFSLPEMLVHTIGVGLVIALAADWSGAVGDGRRARGTLGTAGTA